MFSKKGFTLIEVIIVTLIIAALALLVAPSFKNSALTNQMEKAKIGLIELTTAVKLYNEVNPSNQLSGVFNDTMFTALTHEDTDQGYVYLQNSNRWNIRSSNEYSLYTGGVVLNCRYTIGNANDSIVSEAKCKFQKVDSDNEYECYKFYIQRVNPAVIKKQRFDGDNTCDDL